MSHTSPKNWDGNTPCPRCVKLVEYNKLWWVQKFYMKIRSKIRKRLFGR